MAEKHAFQEIAPDELHKWMQQGRDVAVIHVLPVEIFQRRRIPGSHNACVYEVTFAGQVENIVSDLNKPVVLYGTSSNANEAAAAADKLTRLRYSQIYILTGGISAWLACDYSLTGEVPAEALDPATTIALEDGNYQVDLQKSVIEWIGRNPNGKHWGTLELSSGSLAVNAGLLEGSFDIDMTSIKNVDLAGDELQPVLLSHLESDDFFFTRLFPKARFVISGSESINDQARSAPNFQIRGLLELRGMSAEISFPATVGVLADGNFAAEAHFDIDRTRWNIHYGSSRFFEHLGMHLVFDPVSIQLLVVTI